ncbi:uncharacterized protein LOC128966171 [Oppia nitens]|uniref:uncharacterized protein LOC128966171 n=1 Tax=Oppia nitens TaxID=1686743 RepID=UPI0023D9D9F0|nr:uncharacterized protein LOC128966171 [Oppia nitens]
MFTFYNSINCNPIDLTLVPGSIGQDVVQASLAKVNQIKLFADDLGFLFRLALVETNFGQNPRTFATNNNNTKNNESPNIWSIDEQKFRETQEIQKYPELLGIYYELADKYDIDWQRLDLDDMQRPLYSALASKMFLHLSGQPIPETIDDQAHYWKQHYTTSVQADVQQFVRDVHKLEDLFECTPHINLCYVLDGSGSIAPNDFQMAKDFLYKVTDKISSENGQFCLVLFSTGVQTIYDFSLTNKPKRLDLIRNIRQPNGVTNTRGGIQQTVDIMRASSPIAQIPYKTMFVLTDGKSNHITPGVQPAVSNAQLADINSWVWGVGRGVYVRELLEIAYNLPENVKQLTKYSSMDSYLYQFKTTVCSEPLQLIIGQKFKDTTVKQEKRYYIIGLPKTAGGINLTVQTTKGKLQGYYAYSTPHPSSAVNDGQFADHIYITGQQQQHSLVYVAIVGQQIANAYSIIATNA